MIPLLWPARQTFFFFLHVGCLLHALLKFCWSPQWFLACSFLPQIVMPQCCGFVALMPMQCCLSACCGKETEGCILEGSLSSDAVKAQPYVSSMFWSVYNITHVPLWSHDSGHNFSYMVCFSFWIIPFSFYSIRFDQVPPDMKSMHTGSLLSHKFLSSQFLLLVQVVGKRQDWCCGKWSFRRTALATVECSEEVTCYQDL